MITYGSCFSGIEAATVAWHPLGMRPVWFAEIDKCCKAVLRKHWPWVMNLGDVTTMPDRIRYMVHPPDIIVGGSPCQAYSVSGRRMGMQDPRGKLIMSFLDVIDANDEARERNGQEGTVVVYENVPGLLSDRENAFGCFLGDLAGEENPLEPPGTRWSNAGCVYGPKRIIAWRVLNAQYFGVPQRRNRIFLVAVPRTSRIDPTKVLFECKGVRRNLAAGQDTEQGVAGNFAAGVGIGCFQHSSMKGKGTVGYDDSGIAKPVMTQRDGQMILLPCVTGQHTHALTTKHDGSEDGTGRGTPIVVALNREMDPLLPTMVKPLMKQAGVNNQKVAAGHVIPCLDVSRQVVGPEDVPFIGTGDGLHADTITASAGRTYTNEGVTFRLRNVVCVHENQRSECTLSDTMRTLACTGGKPGQGYPAVLDGRNALGVIFANSTLTEHIAPTLTTRAGAGGSSDPTLLTLECRGRGDGCNLEVRDDGIANCLRSSNGGRAGIGVGAIAYGTDLQVDPTCLLEECHPTLCTGTHGGHGTGLLRGLCLRRLTPRECERLQGFPDDHTAGTTDGPRYKMLGNSMAVPVMRWIGQRLLQEMTK